jgi:hypothetical protein
MDMFWQTAARRLWLTTVLITLIAATPALAQPPVLWGEMALPGGAVAARDAMRLGDPDGRLESTVLVDFIRRYANTDLRTAAERFELHLLSPSPPGPGQSPRSDPSVLPLPLPAFWQETLGRRDVPLVVSLLRSRPALLIYYGLMALDTPTLTDLSARTTLLRRLQASRVASAAFATFGQSLHIGATGVITPGGADSAAVWQGLVGHSPSDTDAFVAELLERDDGRLAWFYDTVSALPDAVRRFVLAANRPPAERVAAVQAVYARFAEVDRAWRIDVRPLHRPPFDGAIVLMALDVRGDGTLGPDWWPALFDGVARASDWSAPLTLAEDTSAVRPADAQWLFDWVFAIPDQARRRFAALRFAQRVFASTPRDDAPHMRVAIGAALEMPSLIFSAERLGVRDPEMLATLARAARAATYAGGEGRVVPAIARWQAALGLLEQSQRRAALPTDRITALVGTLASVAPVDADADSGAVAAWIHDELLPSLVTNAAAFPTLEDAFLHAATTPRRGTRPAFTWEGLPYIVDEPAVTRRSATTIRQLRSGPRLQDLVELHQIRRALLDASASTAGEARRLAARLERLSPALAPVGELEDDRIRDLRRAITSMGGTGIDIARHLPAVTAALDAVTEAVVPSLLYALAVAPTSEPILYPDAWTRHSLQRPFGLPDASGRSWRQVAWQFPTDYGLGGGTRLIGAYLAVDVALADSQLVRVVSPALPVPGVVDDPTRRGLVEQLVLSGLSAPPDISPAEVAALATGRQLVDTWQQAPPAEEILLEALRRASVDAWRTNVIAWEVARGRTSALRTLSVTELARLGSPAALAGGATPGWSGSSRLFDGCLCRLAAREVPYEQMRGRRLGLQAFRRHDIALQLANTLASMNLDLTLVPALLPMALQDWLDRARPAWPDDWEAFTVWPKALGLERVEEYLLQLVSTGVFSPPPTQESQR